MSPSSWGEQGFPLDVGRVGVVLESSVTFRLVWGKPDHPAKAGGRHSVEWGRNRRIPDGHVGI